jgi:hypothetical protein
MGIKARLYFIKNPATKSRVPSVSKNPPAIGAGKMMGSRIIFGPADEEDFPFAAGTQAIVAGSIAC